MIRLHIVSVHAVVVGHVFKYRRFSNIRRSRTSEFNFIDQTKISLQNPGRLLIKVAVKKCPIIFLIRGLFKKIYGIT